MPPRTTTTSKKRKKDNVNDIHHSTKHVKTNHNDITCNDNVLQAIPSNNSPSHLSSSTSCQSIQTKLPFVCIPKHKSNDNFFKLKDNTISLHLRDQFKLIDGTDQKQIDYLKQIGISLKSNFCTKRNRYKSTKTTNKTNATRRLRSSTLASLPCPTIPNNTSLNPNNSTTTTNHNIDILNGYLRCYVEDYMGISQGDSVILLNPKDTQLFPNSIAKDSIQIGNKEFELYKCRISHSPFSENVTNGISNSDLLKGFGRQNYGSYLQIGTNNVLVTWKDILIGRKSGMQIWRKNDKYRDVYNTFKSRQRTKDGHLSRQGVHWTNQVLHQYNQM
jgi:hypothetical protein